jgi:Flp pilus assembly protein TadD
MRYCLICKSCYDDDVGYCEADGAQTARLMPGERTIEGKYEIQKLLGQGGMGAVFESVQRGIERRVAVKLINPSFVANEQALERFKREALASGRVKHPNAITVYDFGVTEAGLAYLVMEFLTGSSLRDELAKERVLSPERAVEILAPVCSAIESAHRQGIVHRDLKPDNIFLEKLDDETVTPKVLDFGIAKLRTPQPGAPDLTGEGSSIGTPAYMSPEQAKGLQLDARSDVYALGVIAYEMLSGALPFQSSSPMGYLVQHMMEAPIPLSAANPSISPAIEETVMRALDKSPDERPQSALEFARALSDAVEGGGERRDEVASPGFQRTVTFLKKLGAETVAAGRATLLDRTLLGWPVGIVRGVAADVAAEAFAELARELVAAAAQRVSYAAVFEGARRWAIRRLTPEGLLAPNATPGPIGAAPRTAGLALYCAQAGLAWAARMPSGAELPLVLRVPGDDDTTTVTLQGVATYYVKDLPGGHVVRLVARLDGREVWSDNVPLADGATSLALCVPEPDATATQNPEMFAHLFGTLEVHASVAGAEIFVDGGPVAWALTLDGGPTLLYCLVPGSHRIVVRKRYFKPAAGDVEIAPGARSSFAARLEPAPSTLRLASNQPGTIVEIVGPEPSQTIARATLGAAGAPHEMTLAAGVYTLRAAVPAFAPWAASVELAPEGQRYVEVALRPIPCPLCGAPAGNDTFSCPSCHRSNLHAFHKYAGATCIECAARAAFDRAATVQTAEAWREYLDGFRSASDDLARRAEAALRRIADRARAAEIDERAERFARLAARGEIAPVVASWRQAAVERPNESATRLAFAAALEAARERDAALAEYAAAVGLAPRDPFARRELARLLVVAGRTGDAVREYSSAVSLKPDFAEAHFELASLLASTGQMASAVEGFRTAASLRPENSRFFEAYARALAEIGRFREAAVTYRHAAICRRREGDEAAATRDEQQAEMALAQTAVHKAGRFLRDLI